MNTVKLFANGQSQAVRLPKERRFQSNEVNVRKIGDTVMLFPKEQRWETFLDGLNGFTQDYLAEERDQDVQLPRDSL